MISHETTPLLPNSFAKYREYEEEINNDAQIKWNPIVQIIILLVTMSLITSSFFSHQSLQLGRDPQDFDEFAISKSSSRNVDSFKVTLGSLKEVYAEGTYIRDSQGSGWNHFEVTGMDLTYASRDELFEKYFTVMEAMGYLEGYATCSDLNRFYVNFYSGLFDGGDPMPETVQFLLDNYTWMSEQAELEWKHSSYWLSVRALLSQLRGLLAGVQRGCPGSTPDDPHPYLPSLHKNPSIIHLLLLNGLGDMYQIATKFEQPKSPPSIADDDVYSYGPTEDSNASNEGNITTKSISDRKDGRLRLGRKLFRQMSSSSSSSVFASEPATPSSSGRRHLGGTHCSALVKLTPNHRDLLFAHNTWDDFQCAAPRVFKRYSYPLLSLAADKHEFTRPSDRAQSSSSSSSSTSQGEEGSGVDTADRGNVNSSSGSRDGGGGGVLSRRAEVHFSSSPGFLTSMDDFFVSHAWGDLAVMETSEDIYNASLLELIQPQSLLCWVRTRVATQLARSGDQWARLFSYQHSGTYTNQWMVVDMARFQPGAGQLAAGLLTVLEEMPGLVRYEDVTSTLAAQGFWASYNNAYFEDIREVSGATALCAGVGVEDEAAARSFCYEGDPRAQIFRARQGAVHGLSDLRALMGYNNFREDPLSGNSSSNAISCRADLEPDFSSRYPFGAIDYKVSSALLSSRSLKKGPVQIQTRLGPTHDDVEPFCWAAWDERRNKRERRFSHLGHPACFQYDWTVMPPQDTQTGK